MLKLKNILLATTVLLALGFSPVMVQAGSCGGQGCQGRGECKCAQCQCENCDSKDCQCENCECPCCAKDKKN